MAPMIHPTAIVHESAVLGDDVQIGPWCLVGAGARLGAGTRLEPHAIVRDGCEIGEQVLLDSFVVVGGEAQMRVPDPAARDGRVVVGARSILREGVTVHRPAKAGGTTEIGPDCFFMAHSHVAHDCKVAAFVTLANGAMLGGHVTIGEHAFVGGGAGVHQFVRIGEGAMVAGNAAISYDVPPFTIAADRNDICGLNLVGMRRRAFAADVLPDLKRCFRAVFLSGGNPRDEARRVLECGDGGATPQGKAFLHFFTGGHRGFGRKRRSRRGGDAAVG
jgi:UDP-N-acetylglucosamine acyltransferase